MNPHNELTLLSFPTQDYILSQECIISCHPSLSLWSGHYCLCAQMTAVQLRGVSACLSSCSGHRAEHSRAPALLLLSTGTFKPPKTHIELQSRMRPETARNIPEGKRCTWLLKRLLKLPNLLYIFKGDRASMKKNHCWIKITSILVLKWVNCLQAQIPSLYIYR